MKIDGKDSSAIQLFIAILFALVGALQLGLYWDGFIAWIRICNMSYEEVRTTPFLPIWTSIRAVSGIIFLTVSAIWFVRFIRLKRRAQG